MTPDHSMPDPYQDYDPHHAKIQGIWLAMCIFALMIVSAFVYFGAQRANVASNPHPAIEEPTTTGSAPSSR
jgi:hypothetical protein